MSWTVERQRPGWRTQRRLTLEKIGERPRLHVDDHPSDDRQDAVGAGNAGRVEQRRRFRVDPNLDIEVPETIEGQAPVSVQSNGRSLVRINVVGEQPPPTFQIAAGGICRSASGLDRTAFLAERTRHGRSQDDNRGTQADSRIQASHHDAFLSITGRLIHVRNSDATVSTTVARVVRPLIQTAAGSQTAARLSTRPMTPGTDNPVAISRRVVSSRWPAARMKQPAPWRPPSAAPTTCT